MADSASPVTLHGFSGYNERGCRCDVCRQAGAEYRAARRKKGLPDPDDPRHGETGYSAYGCRCGVCREGIRAARAALRGKGLNPGDPQHGKYGYDTYGCKCDVCSDAARMVRAARTVVPVERVSTCVVCGSSWCPWGEGRVRLLCSKVCAARRKARKRKTRSQGR